MNAQHKSGVWNAEAIRDFWDYWADDPQHYFSFQNGEAIANFLSFTHKLDGTLLDLGCGPGYLLQHLLKNSNLECYGADFSPSSVERANAAFTGISNWNGATIISSYPTEFSDHSFDVVTCIETLEHLDDEALSKVINEAHRLVKPGGIVLFTVPHNEPLDAAKVFCPFCHTEYHPWGHLRSFTVESMQDLLTRNGFKMLFCENLHLKRFLPIFPVSWWHWSPSLLRKKLKLNFSKLLDSLQENEFPHQHEFRLLMGGSGNLCALVTVD